MLDERIGQGLDQLAMNSNIDPTQEYPIVGLLMHMVAMMTTMTMIAVVADDNDAIQSL
jgi:hypothetical protein